MARLINPVLFSQRLGVDPHALEKADLLDPLLNSDTKLFIDPLLLSACSNERISGEAFETLKARFAEIVHLIAASTTPGDIAWRNAARRLDLSDALRLGLAMEGRVPAVAHGPRR